MPDESNTGEVREDSGEGKVVEGRVKLDQGINFYDQFPFSEAIESSAIAFDIPVQELRYTLTNLAREGLGEFYNRDSETSLEARRQRLDQILKSRQEIAKVLPSKARASVAKSENFPNLHHAMRRIVTELDQFPMWDEYIGDRMGALSPSEYKVDGTFATQKTRPEMAQSYLSWSTARTARQARIAELKRLKGSAAVVIAQVFPQGSTRETTADVMPGGSVAQYRIGPMRRHYR